MIAVGLSWFRRSWAHCRRGSRVGSNRAHPPRVTGAPPPFPDEATWAHEPADERVDREKKTSVNVDDIFPTGVTTAQIVLAVLSIVVGWIASHVVRKGVLTLAAEFDAVGLSGRGDPPLVPPDRI